jgi:hypothetical protein
MKIIIKLNIKKTPAPMLAGCKSAREMWVTLQTQYEGTGAVLNYNAIESCTKIVEDNNYVIGDCGAAL